MTPIASLGNLFIKNKHSGDNQSKETVAKTRLIIWLIVVSFAPCAIKAETSKQFHECSVAIIQSFGELVETND